MIRIGHKLILLTVLMSSYALADDTGFFIGSDLQLLTTDDSSHDEDDNLTATGLSLTAGYKFNHYIGVETSYSVSDDFINDDGFNHVDASLMGYLPLSDVFDLYLGVGAAVYNSHVLGKAKVGISYQFNDNFSWLAGYTFYSEPHDWDSSVNTFDIGFRYRFSQSNVETQNVSITRPVETLIPEPIKQVEPVYKPECYKKTIVDSYVIKKGDWLFKIAKKFNLDSDKFFNLNSHYINSLKDINVIQPGDVVEVVKLTNVCK